MPWNKVYARIKYKSGEHCAYAIADSTVQVGDKCICSLLSGYNAECVIQQIVKENIKGHLDNHAKIIKVIEPKNQEEIEMINELFATVTVESPHGRKTVCKALCPIDISTEVVYESLDGSMHVGTVIDCIQAGEASKQVYTGKYVVQIIDTAMRDQAEMLESDYKATLTQLNLRKKQFEERAIWEMLAEKDPEARTLLAKLDDLKGRQA